jgi:hypothetical protein
LGLLSFLILIHYHYYFGDNINIIFDTVSYLISILFIKTKAKIKNKSGTEIRIQTCSALSVWRHSQLWRKNHFMHLLYIALFKEKDKKEKIFFCLFWKNLRSIRTNNQNDARNFMLVLFTLKVLANLNCSRN